MPGLGSIINAAAIVVAGLAGCLMGSRIPSRIQDSLMTANALAVLFLGIGGAMAGMLRLSGSSLSTHGTVMMVVSLADGAVIGEIIDLEKQFTRFGEWLKKRTGNAKDQNFVNAFVTASLTVCIGAMAVVGAIQDGISGDYSTLAVKAVLDLIIIAVMTSSLGKGCVFSAIPVFLFEGAITVLARLISPVMTDAAVASVSLVGSVLIFCVGLNLVWGKKVRVANMLPAVLLAVLSAYLPWTF